MLIYNIGLWLFHSLAKVYSVFNAKAKLFVDGRKDSFRRLNEYHAGKQGNEVLYWFHCASLGEFEQARPLIEAIKNAEPRIRIAISFFSPSGYEVQKNYAPADLVFYLPVASKANADEVLRLLGPDKIFFIKYEFWLHYINRAHRLNIPVFLVSALFMPGQIFFAWYGKLFFNVLGKYAKIFVQDEASYSLLKKYEIQSIITGDTRFDRVLANRAKAGENSIVASFAGHNKIVVLGSSWQKEEELIFKTYDPKLHYKIIIAPHDVKRNIVVPETIGSIRYSEANPENIADKDVLIIDNVGLLSSLYKYASIAFVGGGYRGSLHNILEAAVFGIPVLYGPRTQKHPEAEALQEAGGGEIIRGEKPLKALIRDLLTHENLRIRMGSHAYTFIERNAGATQKIISEI